MGLLEGSLLRTFEEGGVLITERSAKRLPVGHRREMLFDWSFSSTILMYLLVDAVSGHCNAVRAFESLIFHKECQYFERGIPSSYLRHTGFRGF